MTSYADELRSRARVLTAATPTLTAADFRTYANQARGDRAALYRACARLLEATTSQPVQLRTAA